MSSLTSIYLNVNGTYIPYNAQYEYTSGDVTSAWGSSINAFLSLYNKATVGSNGQTTVTADDVANIQAALAQLMTLAQVGVTKQSTDSSGNTVTKTSYLTYTMANNLNQLLVSLKSAGITVAPSYDYVDVNGNTVTTPVLDINGNPLVAGKETPPGSGNRSPYLYAVSGVTVDSLIQWKDLANSTTGVQDLLKSSVSEATTGTRSLQSLVELDFVQAGNELLTNQLASLQQQLATTSKVLTNLTTLQNLHNSLIFASAANFSAYFDIRSSQESGVGDPNNPISEKLRNDQFIKLYGSAASAYFGRPIVPVLPLNLANDTTDFAAAKNQLVTARIQLQSSVFFLSSIATSAQLADPNSLYNQIKKVLHDISAVFVTPTGQPITADTSYADSIGGFTKWVLDNYQNVGNLTSSPGGYQTNITAAITAGSSTNDTQKQQVQNAIYIFEEFYKAASSILQSLTQIITKIAQNIAR